METVSEDKPRTSWIAAVMVFIMHLVIATGIIFVTAPLLLVIVMDLLEPIGKTIPHSYAIIAETPYFPVQITLGLFLGWSLSGYLRHRSMLWVWIIPALVLCYVFIEFSTRSVLFPQWAYLSSSSRLSHFFGRGCQPKNFCFDQMYFTLPFYSAAAYSLGALLARKMTSLSTYAEVMTDIKIPRVCLAGVCAVCLHLGLNWRMLNYNWIAQACLGMRGFLWRSVLLFGLSTYILMVVISLIGRRFFITRWFLNPASPVVAGEMNEQA